MTKSAALSTSTITSIAVRTATVLIVGSIIGAGAGTLPAKAEAAATTISISSKAARSVDSPWTGYAATGRTFTHVGGSWKVPTATCPSGSTSDSAAWIGIDGAKGSTVEQAGTDSGCKSGTPYYYAWFELFGTNYNSGNAVVSCAIAAPLAVCVPFVPAAGDAMSAAVSVSGTAWTITIGDATQNKNFSITIANPLNADTNAPPAKASAEWIVEEDGSALTDFGSVSFTKAVAVAGGHAGSAAKFATEKLNVLNARHSVLAAASSLRSNGKSFVATWYHNS
jgi:hypothetical protein